jgi:hypothetical protein
MLHCHNCQASALPVCFNCMLLMFKKASYAEVHEHAVAYAGVLHPVFCSLLCGMLL